MKEILPQFLLVSCQSCVTPWAVSFQNCSDTALLLGNGKEEWVTDSPMLCGEEWPLSRGSLASSGSVY